MGQQLKNIVRFTAVPAGGSAQLPHDLHVDGRAVVPDVVFGDETDFTVDADDTNVMVTNTGGVASDLNVYVEHWHTYERVFGDQADTELAPQPFRMTSGGSASGGGATTTFRYTATGGEGSDFFVSLPAARANDDYAVMVAQAGVAAILGIDLPDLAAGDRTTTQFRVVTSAAIQAGDQLDFVVQDF